MIKKQKFYFLHIPKTAGTSLNAWLHTQNCFTICPEGLWSRLLKRNYNSLNQFNLFAGHFYTYLDSYLKEPLNTFTFLRHPVQRSISHYLHILRDSAHYLHGHTKRMREFGDFMRDPATRPMIENFQTRALSMRFDILNLSKQKSWFSRDRYFIERHIEGYMCGYLSTVHLPLAKQYLEGCCCVGITERMEESMHKLKKVLNISPYTGEVPSLNVSNNTSSSTSLSDDEHSMLMGLVADDMALYEYANSILDAPYDNFLRAKL